MYSYVGAGVDSTSITRDETIDCQWRSESLTEPSLRPVISDFPMHGPESSPVSMLLA